MRVNIMVLFVVCILMSGCTAYGPSGFSGGYSDKKTSRNTFDVLFSGNGYTSSQRAFDLCLLRGAELTINNGFIYFVVNSADSKIDSSTSMTVGNYVRTGSGGIYTSSTTPVHKPSNNISIISFIRAPVQYKDYYHAREIVNKLSNEHGVSLSFDKVANKNHDIIKFKRSSDYDFLSPIPLDNVKVVKGEIMNIDSSVILSSYVDYEMPFFTENELIINLKRSASKIGADLVTYDDNYSRIQSSNRDKRIAFVAYASKTKISKLGIHFDNEKLKEGKYIIDSYDSDSNVDKSGLLIGDRILLIQKIDPKNRELAKDMLTWEPGKEVIITVARNGKQIEIPIKTSPNL